MREQKEKIDDDFAIAVIFVELGRNYSRIRDKQRHIHYLSKARNILEQLEDQTAAALLETVNAALQTNVL